MNEIASFGNVNQTFRNVLTTLLQCRIQNLNYLCSMIAPYNDAYFMKQALLEAQKAFDIDEEPVGAVIVCKNQIIARAHNLTESLNDVTAHA